MGYLVSKLTNSKAIKVWLAPMSGATDAPFRRQAVHFGASFVVSEMTASEQLVAARPDVVRRAARHEGDSPWIVQLAGRDPDHMCAGAALLAEAGVDMIDINMGCPARKVTGGLSGSALMREPELADAIIKATLEGAGGVPVSLKMRLGWDDDMLNAPDLAARAEAAGVIHLAVHGRTRCQFYKGKADWARIKDTVKAVSIPVIANGDINNLQDAQTSLAQSGAMGVMMGRAAIGRPWLPAMIEAGLNGQPILEPDVEARFDSLSAQIEDAAALYGDAHGVRICRKHISASIAHLPIDISPEHRRTAQSAFCQIESSQELIAALQTFYLKSEMQEVA